MAWMISASLDDIKVAKKLQKQDKARSEHSFQNAEKRVWVDCKMRQILQAMEYEDKYPDIEHLRVVVRDAEHLKADESMFIECRHLLYRMDVCGDHRRRKKSKGPRGSPRNSPRGSIRIYEEPISPRRSPRAAEEDTKSSPRGSRHEHGDHHEHHHRHGYEMTSPRGAAVFEKWLNEKGLERLIRGAETNVVDEGFMFQRATEDDIPEPNPEEQACYLREQGQVLSTLEFRRLHRTYGLKPKEKDHHASVVTL
eukprot:gnl/TRDRNA2_/TRDRNA2_42341_c0_seq1.p1 gnl/TRDRNA2_/TRDRNA2_42341_c0~~gnl/TRDRNA2_/TRDRNA2_42341_c0_seq1.p1  ORF type:complete len:253 (-),score=36.11 gnl/TRDRNA2_/TRDRNA2_42341_c0_seq1:185-943(-)